MEYNEEQQHYKRRSCTQTNSNEPMKAATSIISLSHLPLRPSTLQLLTSRGFTTAEEVQESYRSGGLTNLAAELGSSLATAGGIWQELQQQLPKDAPQKLKENTLPLTAQQILSQQQQQPGSNDTSNSNWQRLSIITFCREIDQLLGGGIALGELTEIAGSPGAGKTQWGMQLAVDASLPSWAGGVCGETVYIDTEGSFSPERCYLLAEALIQHIQTGLKRRKSRGGPEQEWNVTPEQVLEGIHVIRVHDEAALHAVLEGSLPKMAQERAAAGSPLKLVVVDSIAFPIRAAPPPSIDPTTAANGPSNAASSSDDSEFYVTRTRQLALFATQLSQLAAKFRLAAVAINQMTTKVFGQNSGGGSATTSSDNSGSQLVPALGESWAHAVTTRIVLSMPFADQGQQRDKRTCSLVKSPRLPSGIASYQIMECGVRGVDYQGRGSSSGSNKRPRS